MHFRSSSDEAGLVIPGPYAIYEVESKYQGLVEGLVGDFSEQLVVDSRTKRDRARLRQKRRSAFFRMEGVE